MDKVINVELMRHPANWFVVTLMFILASFAIRFVMQASAISGPTTA
jgi:hypothetical protein